MSWSTSDRRARLPKDWHRRRAIAQRTAGGRCQAVDDQGRCPKQGTDCDHIRRDAGDDPANLQWLCRAHHTAKTQREANAAKLRRQRETGKHPGLR